MYSSLFDMRWASLAVLLVLVTGCEDYERQYRFGTNITGLQFEFFDADEGVHPSDIVLTNPNNPFRNHPISNEAKFEILASGGNAGGFYAWATLLANIPTGEHQFFTAVKAHDIATSGELESEEDVCRVTLIATRGYQTVLDEFPDSVSFLEDGTPFYLAPLAYRGIESLGQPVQGDWVLSVDADGNDVVTRIAGRDTPRTVFPPPEGQEGFDPCAP